jgi:hypothetical protein
MKYELKTLSFGDTLGTAFTMYLDNFVILFTICLVISIPLIVFSLYISQAAIVLSNSGDAMSLLTLGILFILYYVLSSAVETGLIINYVSHKYLGEEINIKDLLVGMQSHILPLIGLSLLVGLCIAASFVLAIIPFLGVFLIVIYAIYMSIRFILSTQVLVLENRGVIESMKRSWELTKGKKLIILGFIIINSLIALFFNYITSSLSENIIGAIGFKILLIESVISYISMSLVAPFSACVYVLIYFNIRIEKEGFALEHLADQFLPGEEEDFLD